MNPLFAGAPFKRILVVDAETAWCRKQGLSLSVQTTEEYIRDPRFKVWGFCIKEYGEDKARTQWYRHDELPRILRTYDWSTTAIMAQNAMFDGAILEWVYGVHPCFIFDTLSMARAVRGVLAGNSLAQLAQDYGLAPKGDAVYSTEGILDVLPPHIEQELASYCAHDVFLCEELFKRLSPGYPIKELRLIDLTIKMYTRAQLRLDTALLQQEVNREREAREGLLHRLGMTDSQLASNPQFAEALKALGVTPPTKVSKTTGKETFAFAKNDAKFQALLEGDNDDIAQLCQARLKVKSTQERTRAQRLIGIAERGPMPVPLTYYGAFSGRWTAAKGSHQNMQNMKRGSFLRKAVMAPEGHMLVVGDLAQIEPRVLGWLADYDDLLNIFRSGQDAYAMFGRQMFNRPDLTKENAPDLRQSAKSALLGCGFGLGFANFAQQLLTGFLGAPPVRYDKAFAQKLGVTSAWAQRFLGYDYNVQEIGKIQANCTPEELVVHCLAAARIIEIYRDTAAPVKAFWGLLDTLIEHSLYGGQEYTHKCLTFRKEEIVLPSGMSLRYPNLKRGKDEKGRVQWTYGDGTNKLYAGRVTNHVTQGTARIVMTDGMLRTSRRYFVAGTVHDEQIVVVPQAEAEEGKKWVLEQMTLEPRFLPGIPLAADGGVHERYGLAKG